MSTLIPPPIIEYTQSTVAWPQLAPNIVQDWVVDHMSIGYRTAPGGEFSIDFMRFDRETRLHAQINVFHDGLGVFYDERVQRVMAAWRKADDEASIGPDDFIAWLEAEGAVPSSYHLEGLERTEDETAFLRAMRK